LQTFWWLRIEIMPSGAFADTARLSKTSYVSDEVQ
jgi:hypothetical protein